MSIDPRRTGTLRLDLIHMSRGNWADCERAANRVAARIEAIEARQRNEVVHDPGCLGRVHGTCTCWLSKPPPDQPTTQET